MFYILFSCFLVSFCFPVHQESIFLYLFNKLFQIIKQQHLWNNKIYEYQLNAQHVPKFTHHLLLPPPTHYPRHQSPITQVTILKAILTLPSASDYTQEASGPSLRSPEQQKIVALP